MATDTFFGLSVSTAGGGPAIVVNTWERISVERWIFTAAHELGHLVVHSNAYDIDQKEPQRLAASVFKASFPEPQG